MIIRQPRKGMGEAVAKRTVYRESDGESWLSVASRVAVGNGLLHPSGAADVVPTIEAIAKASTLLSGRHLQHGDAQQPSKNIEVYTNCSTAALSSVMFYLLLRGSGVGRCYDDALMLLDFEYLPNVIVTLSEDHPDWERAKALGFKPASYYNPAEGYGDMDWDEWRKVPDSVVGWTQEFEYLEKLVHARTHEGKTIVLDFTPVRKEGAPIKGMQDRPAPGPVPTMIAFREVAEVKGKGWKPWKQAVFIDHHLAASVASGGARRSARIGVKYWKEPDILEFITVKKANDLWSANNSLAVDKEFWALLDAGDPQATLIFDTLVSSCYLNGEPGIINVDKLTTKNEGFDKYQELARSGKPLIGNPDYTPGEVHQDLVRQLLELVLNHPYQYIVNPCGEVALFILGGYCIIADGVPYFCDTLEESLELMDLLTRFLMRVNLMPALYQVEVLRTNRIGVSLTGIFEFAWKFFGLGFRDLLDEYGSAAPFWKHIAKMKRRVSSTASAYAKVTGQVVPHTDTCLKPAGTNSKLQILTEAAHLPAMLEYLRWVQDLKTSPRVKALEAKGYPVRWELKSYPNMAIVGFPTQPEICRLDIPNEKLVTAAQATLEEQYKWVALLEKYWIDGVWDDGTPLGNNSGNQVSFTCKYDPKTTPVSEVYDALKTHHRAVKCFTIMPQDDNSAYEYQPEQPVTAAEFTNILKGINDPEMLQEIDMEQLRCQSGLCPM